MKLALILKVPHDPPLQCTDEQFRTFVASLNFGDRVVECGRSMMTGETGTIVPGTREGEKCIKWDIPMCGLHGTVGQMTTSITFGARKFPSNLHI